MSTEPLHWFKNFTTLGGLGQIIGSTEKHWKAFWAFLTLAFLAMTGYSALSIIVEYSQFNVVTDFSVPHKDHLVLPSVTICNANRIHCGNLMRKLEEYDKVNETRKELLCKLLKLTGCDESDPIHAHPIHADRFMPTYSCPFFSCQVLFMPDRFVPGMAGSCPCLFMPRTIHAQCDLFMPEPIHAEIFQKKRKPTFT